MCLAKPSSGWWQLAQLTVRVGREPRIEVQLPAQFDLGPRERVLVEALDLAGAGGQAQGQLEIERLVIARVVEPGFDLGELERTFAGNAGGQLGRAEQDFAARRRLAAVVAGGGVGVGVACGCRPLPPALRPVDTCASTGSSSASASRPELWLDRRRMANVNATNMSGRQTAWLHSVIADLSPAFAARFGRLNRRLQLCGQEIFVV